MNWKNFIGKMFWKYGKYKSFYMYFEKKNVKKRLGMLKITQEERDEMYKEIVSWMEDNYYYRCKGEKGMLPSEIGIDMDKRYNKYYNLKYPCKFGNNRMIIPEVYVPKDGVYVASVDAVLFAPKKKVSKLIEDVKKSEFLNAVEHLHGEGAVEDFKECEKKLQETTEQHWSMKTEAEPLVDINGNQIKPLFYRNVHPDKSMMVPAGAEVELSDGSKIQRYGYVCDEKFNSLRMQNELFEKRHGSLKALIDEYVNLYFTYRTNMDYDKPRTQGEMEVVMGKMAMLLCNPSDDLKPVMDAFDFINSKPIDSGWRYNGKPVELIDGFTDVLNTGGMPSGATFDLPRVCCNRVK